MLTCLVLLSVIVSNPVKASSIIDKVKIDSENFITGFTFHERNDNNTAGNEKYVFRHREQLIIKVNFEEGTHKFLSNQYIEFDAPPQLDLFALTGDRVIELKSDNGVHYGNVHTSEDIFHIGGDSIMKKAFFEGEKIIL